MKVLVIGLDALCSKLVKRFINEGLMPNMKKLFKQGAYSDCLSYIPAQTPENWTSIATGASPGTHGIATWGRHLPGDKVTELHSDEAMSSNLCKAEYIWEAASRQGKKSLLLHFPGYPPASRNVYFIEWLCGPHNFYFAISRESRLYTEKEICFEETEKNRISFNLPYSDVLKGKIPVEKGLEFDCFLVNKKANGYDKLLLYYKGKKVCEVKKGKWSNWIKSKFQIDGKTLTGSFRFHLIDANPDNFKLYRTQIFPVEEFTHPGKIGKELVSKFGPFIYCGAELLWFREQIDDRILIDESRYMFRWVSKAVRYMMDRYGCSLFMMHWHFPDSLQHKYLGMIDPEGGQYDPEKAHLAWNKVRLGYKLIDEFIGYFLNILKKNELLSIISDHGQPANKKNYSLLKVLADEGFVLLDENKNPVWEKSKIFVSMTNIYINLKSRYKNGVVEDSEYEDVRERVINILRNLRIKESGEYVMALVLKREDAPLINLWGENIGDIVYVYSQGFTWGHEKYFQDTIPVGGANHGPQIPTAETDVSSNYGVFLLYGPGIKKGYLRNRDFMGPVMTSDLVPTVSHFLGILPPKHCQGRILYDFFEGWDSEPVKRKRQPLNFKKEIKIVGDVTETEIEKKKT